MRRSTCRALRLNACSSRHRQRVAVDQAFEFGPVRLLEIEWLTRHRQPTKLTETGFRAKWHYLTGALREAAQTFYEASRTLVAQLPPVAWRSAQKALRILSSLAHIVSYQGGGAIQIRISYWR
jgi:hypothetical protein